MYAPSASSGAHREQEQGHLEEDGNIWPYMFLPLQNIYYSIHR